MLDLNALAKECMAELDAINIPYCKNTVFVVNSRAKRRWGLCRKLAVGQYQIQISERLLAGESTMAGAKNTVIHELLHTCPGGRGHKGDWKWYALRVNNAYDYNIKRTSSDEEKGVQPQPDAAKYKFICTDCGKIVTRNRASNFTRNYTCYRCASCNGPFKQVI